MVVGNFPEENIYYKCIIKSLNVVISGLQFNFPFKVTEYYTFKFRFMGNFCEMAHKPKYLFGQFYDKLQNTKSDILLNPIA